MKKRKKELINPKSGMRYTVCGEFFPEVYPAFRAERWSRGEETPLDTEMRLFGACMRWAFNRLQEGYTREELKKQGQKTFGLNSRFADDAILKAKEIIVSQKEQLNREIKETEAKLSRAKKKLKQAEASYKKAIAANDPVRIEKAKLAIRGRRARVKKLSDKLEKLKSYRDNNAIPKVVFGGRSLWKRVCKGRATKKEWQNARQNRLYARGDKTKKGNPNIKLSWRNGEFYLAVTVSHLSEQKEVDSAGRPLMTRAPKASGKLWLPEKHRVKVLELLLSGAPYSVELIKGSDSRYRARITFTVESPKTQTHPNQGYLGVDTNPDGVALANVNYFGQPEPWPDGFIVPHPKALYKYAGEFQITIHKNGFLYLTVPELAYGRGHRRIYLTGVLAKVVTDIAKTIGKPIALEKLEFSKDRLDTNKKFNRMAANFPYRKVTEAVIRRAFKEGIGVKPVWPAHTSTIGWWKYMQQYGITVHHAAALVIARRASGFKEYITRELKQKIQSIREELNQKVNSLPGEGKGMTRKAKRLFKRLEEKISFHNGLTRFKQESFYSVWHNLKELALLK
ncbi:MAG: transposase [Syntrophothermus sp.]|uniref:transposase n=1 Tax=Syntrophothermus sp. TaxID=2736299 RepID=UPI002579F89A|nr:transposase [Syntrophothermus sp.]NSW82734.1 transposase [Syntrophothermus sp.]